MSSLHDLNDIASGDPDRLRAEVDQLRTVTENIDVVLRLLRAVSTHGVWESPAGVTFAEQVGATPEDLDLVCARLHDAAAVIGPYADRLEDNQRRLRDLDERYAEANRTRETRDEQLAELPAEHPDRPRLTIERGEASRTAHAAASAFERESDEALGDERRVAGRLSDVCIELADPRGYDAAEATTDLGTSARTSPLAWAGGPVSWVGVAQPIGLGVRRAVYGEGSWGDVAESSVVSAADGVGWGAGKVVKGARKVFPEGAPPPPISSSGRFPTTPGKAFGNPIASRRLRDIASARTKGGRLAQTVKHDAADRISKGLREKTGINHLEEFADDWQAVAGSHAGRAVVVGAYTTRHMAGHTSTVYSTKYQIERRGLTVGEDEPEGRRTAGRDGRPASGDLR